MEIPKFRAQLGRWLPVAWVHPTALYLHCMVQCHLEIPELAQVPGV